LPKLIILGTASAVPDREHETTHLAVISESCKLLIDTGSNPTVRLKQAGLDPLELTDLLLTHFHPDHVSGVPALLMNSWLLGRKERLTIHGLEDTLSRIEKTMELYEWASWPNFFPVSMNALPGEELMRAIASPDLCVFTSPVCHMIPAIGLKIESPMSGRVIAYSCDTEPCEQVVRLAAGADILIHEATGTSLGHSSAAQAGEAARQAGAKALYLIHYPTGDFDPAPLVEEAQREFPGPVTLTRDFMEVDF